VYHAATVALRALVQRLNRLLETAWPAGSTIPGMSHGIRLRSPASLAGVLWVHV